MPSKTEKFIDELVAWDINKGDFKIGVQECLDVIPKLDETQKQQLKEYFSTYIGWCKLKKLGFDVMKQLIKYKAFPYKYFYKFRDKPDFQILMLENINDDNDFISELIYGNHSANICMCNESVFKKIKEIIGINVDLKMSYENLIKYWDEDTYSKNHENMYDNTDYITDVKPDGNCVFYSLIQANENKKLVYNDELKEKVIELRQKMANDYKQNHEFYGDTHFNQKKFDEFHKNYSYCDSQYVSLYFSKRYQKNFFYFNLENKKGSGADPYVYFMRPSGKTEDSIKNTLVDFLNGAPAITFSHRHCKTINTDRNKRKEFVIKFLKLRFYYEMRYSLLNRNDEIPRVFNFDLSCYWLDLLLGLNENQEQKFEEQLVSYFEKIPQLYKFRKILELKKFLIDKFIEWVIEHENINITAEEFFSRVLEDFRIENLAKEQDFDIELRKKFAKPEQDEKKSESENNENKTQTEKPNTQPEKIDANNGQQKIEPKSEQINKSESLKPVIVNNDENNEIDLNLVRNSMLFVSVILDNNKVYEAIKKMSNDDLKDFFEKNKTEIGDAVKKIRYDNKIKEFLTQNTDVQDIIELNNSKIKLLDNKLNEKNSKAWIAGLSSGGVVSVSLGVVAVCTFFSGLVIFPGLAIASSTVGFTTLVLACYKFIDNKIKRNKKSGPISTLKANQINSVMKKINIERTK